MGRVTDYFRRVVKEYHKSDREIISWIIGIIIALSVIIGAVFSGFNTVYNLWYPKDKNVIPGDLTPVFGKNGLVDRIENIQSDEENIRNLRDHMLASQSNIKIVTIDGASWIFDDLNTVFASAQSRIPVTVLMMDYHDKNIAPIWNRAMREYGTGVWDDKKYFDSMSRYLYLMQAEWSKLSIGLYNSYPWTRFTIFDDNSVSFIITPNMKGKGAQKYFSTDSFVVECFEAIFRNMQEQSISHGKFYDTTESAKFADFISKNIPHKPGVNP